MGRIARFIADVNPHISPPCLALRRMDLHRTSESHAETAQAAARAAGLTNVHIGNRHLLSRDHQA